jgi:hypothetical protein
LKAAMKFAFVLTSSRMPPMSMPARPIHRAHFWKVA